MTASQYCTCHAVEQNISNINPHVLGNCYTNNHSMCTSTRPGLAQGGRELSKVRAIPPLALYMAYTARGVG